MPAGQRKPEALLCGSLHHVIIYTSARSLHEGRANSRVLKSLEENFDLQT